MGVDKGEGYSSPKPWLKWETHILLSCVAGVVGACVLQVSPIPKEWKVNPFINSAVFAGMGAVVGLGLHSIKENPFQKEDTPSYVNQAIDVAFTIRDREEVIPVEGQAVQESLSFSGIDEQPSLPPLTFQLSSLPPKEVVSMEEPVKREEVELEDLWATPIGR